MKAQTQSAAMRPINFNALHLLGSIKGLLNIQQKIMLVAITIIGLYVVIKLNIVIGIAFLPFVIIYVFRLIDKRNKKLWKQFAGDNGWIIADAAAQNIQAPPTIASVGRNKVFSEVISGSFSENSFYCYVYKYTDGAGRNEHTYDTTVMQVQLQKPLPSFLLDSCKVSVARDRPSDSSHISLEGDFDKSFKLYASQTAASDVLSVISPDVMQALVQSGTMQDIQVVDKTIWFMQSGDTRNQTMLPALFIAVQALMPELYHRLTSYKMTNTYAHTAVSGYPATGSSFVTQVKNVPIHSYKKIKIVLFILFVAFQAWTFFMFLKLLLNVGTFPS